MNGEYAKQFSTIGAKVAVLIGLMLVGLEVRHGSAAAGGQESNSDSTTDQVSTSKVILAAKDVPRPTSVELANDPERPASTVVFPNGEVIAIKWWIGKWVEHDLFPYDEKFLELRQLAQTGDADAAFSAFGILNSCASTLDSRFKTEMRIDSLRKAMQESQQDSQNAGGRLSRADIERRIDDMRLGDAACRRIDAIEIANREQLLRQAADGGVTFAMNWLGSSTSNHEEAVEVLQKSWHAGSYSALDHLAWRYQQSYATFHRHQDRIRAFATLYAYAALLENAQVSHGYSTSSMTERAWGKVEQYALHVDEGDIPEAIVVAKSMIKNNANCCNGL